MPSFSVTSPTGEVILDDQTRVYSGGGIKKINTSTLIATNSYNGILRSAYDNSLLTRYPIIRNIGNTGNSFPATQRGELFLWQPTEGNTIGVHPGPNVTSADGEEGCLAVPGIANVGNVYPIKLMDIHNYASGYLDVMNASGELIWSAASLMNSPSIVDIIEIPFDNTDPFVNWNKYWDVPVGIDPNNIFFLNMNFNLWNLGEESWYASWVNFTRIGSKYYYRGAANHDGSYANIKNSFKGSFLIYVFHVPNAT